VRAVTGAITIEVVGGVTDVLQVRVAEEGVAFRRLPEAFRALEPTESATVKAKSVEPCRLNTEKSIYWTILFNGNVLTTEAKQRWKICRWSLYRHFGKIL
jgi:hypothetical protein